MAREFDDEDTVPRGLDPTDVAVRRQVYLERYGTSLTADVNAVVQTMGPTAIDIILQLDDQISSLPAREYGALIREAKVANTEIMAKALGELSGQLDLLAVDESRFTARALKATTRKVQIASLRAAEARAAALDKPITATGEMLESFLDGWTKRQVKAVGDTIGKGFTQGWTNQEIITSIRGTKARGFADGLVATTRRNTEAVVRTSIQHVAATVREETYAKNLDVVTGWKFVASLDGVTTQQCRSLDGQIFEVGKGPRPPIHVRCRSCSRPEVAPEFAFLKEGATRSSAVGPVPAKQTYYDWLKGQPSAFQDDAIGPERAKLFRDGGLSSKEFARLNLGRNFEPLTLDEMRAKEPNAFKKAGI